MFAKYSVASGATIANLLADFVAILTGTTDKTTLSAACDQANTYILNTYNNAGWTMYDNVSASQKILTAPTEDALQQKYLEVAHDGSTIRTRLWESWNSTTHVGTNGTGLAQAAPSSGHLNAGSVHYLYATPRTIQGWHNNVGTGGWFIYTMELNRDAWPNITVDAALAIHAQHGSAFTTSLNSNISLSPPRTVQPSTGSVAAGTGNGATHLYGGFPNAFGGSGFAFSYVQNYHRSQANQLQTQIMPMSTPLGVTFPGINMSVKNDSRYAIGLVGAEEFTYAGKTYIAPPITTLTYGLIVVPKG